MYLANALTSGAAGPCITQKTADTSIGRDSKSLPAQLKLLGLGVRVRVSGRPGLDTHVNILGGTAYMLELDIDYQP